jgi:hypothetical protein
LTDDTGLLEEVVDDATPDDGAVVVEVDGDEFTEARGVVVSKSFGISESLEDGIGGEDLLLEIGRSLRRGPRRLACGHISQELETSSESAEGGEGGGT